MLYGALEDSRGIIVDKLYCHVSVRDVHVGRVSNCFRVIRLSSLANKLLVQTDDCTILRNGKTSPQTGHRLDSLLKPKLSQYEIMLHIYAQ